jgi:hypothetical protein
LAGLKGSVLGYLLHALFLFDGAKDRLDLEQTHLDLLPGQDGLSLTQLGNGRWAQGISDVWLDAGHLLTKRSKGLTAE